MKIKYQDSIVAFVDVLGFSRLVYASDNTQIEAYFTYVVDDLKLQLAGTGFEYLLISDSIVVVARNSLPNLKILVKLLSKIQAKLLSRGILMRGAISLGSIHVDRDTSIVVGPGLIRAYELERSATYPRIILDRAFIPLYYGSTKGLMDDFGDWLAVDAIAKYADGVLYINYPRYLAMHNTFYLNGRMDKVITMFNEHYYSDQHYKKYDWLLTHIVHQLSVCLDHDLKEVNPSKQTKAKIKKIQNVLPKFLAL